MKAKICIAAVISLGFNGLLMAQNVGINTTGATPNASAQLDLNTGNTFTSPSGKGLLIPNVALTGTGDATTVGSPATSLFVYNTATAGVGSTAVTAGFYYWDGAKWVAFFGSGSKNWSLTGNAGTTASSSAIGSAVTNNFVGTTDGNNFVVAANNKEVARFLSSGTENLVVNSITAASNDIFSSYSSVATGNASAAYNTSATAQNTSSTFPPANASTVSYPSAIYGKASSISGFGVYGINNSSSSTSTTTIGAGVYGQTASQNGYGIWGVTTAAASTAAPLATAIYGASPNGGYGIYGYSTGGSTTSLFSAGTFGYNSSIYGGAGITGASYSAGNVGYLTFGVLGTNKTTGGAPLYVAPPATFWSVGVYGAGLGVTGTDIGVLGYSADNTTAGWSIYSNGYAGGNHAWITASDARLKENIKPLTGSSLESILKINGYTYNFKEEVTDDYEHQEIGFLSQEVEKIFPQLVFEKAFVADKKKYINNGSNKKPAENTSVPKTIKSLNYTGLIPVMVEAMREQQQQIEVLKTQVAELKKLIQK